ncbi:hypothetical protein GCM10010336_69810 [Streptomyces goshikiensis]|nr:hypothetical protein GCM10010336_69810 [Streptomyces goshikiensis]
MFERAVPLGGLVDLFGDPVDIIGDDVADVVRGGFAIAHPAATDQTDEQLEGVVAAGRYPRKLAWSWDDATTRRVLGRFDASDRVLVEDAHAMCVKQDGSKFIEGIRLCGHADAGSLHIAYKVFDHFVVEAVHTPASEVR